MAKNNAAVSAEAGTLAAVFERVNAFWQKHPNDDALQFSATARDRTKATAAATAQIGQIIGLRKVQDACGGCHLAHRAGKAGDFRIEQ